MKVHSAPELNYVALTGSITWKDTLRRTRVGVDLIEVHLENVITRSFEGGEDRRLSVLEVEAWGDLAHEIHRDRKVGELVMVEGTLVSHPRRLKDGREYHVMKVKASSVRELASPQDESGPEGE